ncbi:MAG: SGNH/GDSL hydrolase family protein [Chloroflexota bacterium]
MKKETRLSIITFLISLLLCGGALEIFLRFDPLGVLAYREWLNFTYTDSRPDPTGYSFVAGTYIIDGKLVTIDERGNRATPTVNSPDCTIAIVGDSVTFGIGVSDDATYPYLLSNVFPQIQFINTGKPGYDSTNLSRVVEDTPADAYIYLIVSNDITAPREHINAVPVSFSAITTHIRYFQAIGQEAEPEPTLYSESLDIITRENVMMFSAGEHISHEHAEVYLGTTIEVIPRETRVSPADGHPNELGHQAIANVIAPYVATLPTNNCLFTTAN